MGCDAQDVYMLHAAGVEEEKLQQVWRRAPIDRFEASSPHQTDRMRVDPSRQCRPFKGEAGEV